jgi:hypothetical protein
MQKSDARHVAGTSPPPLPCSLKLRWWLSLAIPLLKVISSSVDTPSSTEGRGHYGGDRHNQQNGPLLDDVMVLLPQENVKAGSILLPMPATVIVHPPLNPRSRLKKMLALQIPHATHIPHSSSSTQALMAT